MSPAGSFFWISIPPVVTERSVMTGGGADGSGLVLAWAKGMVAVIAVRVRTRTGVVRRLGKWWCSC